MLWGQVLLWLVRAAVLAHVRAHMLAVLFGEASRSGLGFSSPSPLPGGILFAVKPLACSHARALRTLPRPTRTSIGTPLQD